MPGPWKNKYVCATPLMTFVFLAFARFLHDFILECLSLCPSFTMLIPFLHRFEDKQATKVAAGPGVEVRGWGFIITLLKLWGPLKSVLILLFI